MLQEHLNMAALSKFTGHRISRMGTAKDCSVCYINVTADRHKKLIYAVTLAA
jgi:hypothetical protein